MRPPTDLRAQMRPFRPQGSSSQGVVGNGKRMDYEGEGDKVHGVGLVVGRRNRGLLVVVDSAGERGSYGAGKRVPRKERGREKATKEKRKGDGLLGKGKKVGGRL
ncbi:hypothetical protein ACH5RR_002121 [Cinchona calisaya]|uniref:Uncharacterized protein n=1 Tax=Cinchona calisaya TaxID=153742 RepID=A0ABD3B5C6_9GENT